MSAIHKVFSGTISGENADQLEKAAINLRAILKTTPRDANCLHILGLVECQLGRIDTAAEFMVKSLIARPNSAEVQCHYALILMQQQRYPEAITVFKKAIAFNPAHVDSHYHLGNALSESGQLAEAAVAYKQVLALRPDHTEALNNLGNLVANHGNPAEAVIYYRRAIAANPNYAMAYNNMGLAHIALGKSEEAMTPIRKAIELAPNYASAHNSLGVALRMQGRFAESIPCYQKAIALRSDYGDAHNNLGNALKDCGDLKTALAHFEKALEFKDTPDHRHNYALALLAAGRLDEGWREYESRWRMSQMAASHRVFTQPQWRGEAGEGRTLLIHAEQGFGDTLQFCRYVPLAKARGFRVILEVQPALAGLMKSLDGADDIIAQGEPLPAFDLHCPALSLPPAFGTTLENIPAGIPYLAAAPEAVTEWGKKLSHIHALRVGLVWAGSGRMYSPDLIATDRRRSMAPELLAPLLNVAGARFFNLQKQGTQAPASFGLIDLMPECKDFADTAALVSNLDLVITVDTAVAHLAGALGKPVWLLNRYDTCWRWLLDREDSPWYPTLRLFRQKKPGDWQDVIERVRQKLLRAAQAWSEG